MLQGQSKIVETHGAKLYTEQRGNANGKPLLFLHGGLDTLATFEPLLPGLTDYNCILMDSRGHGRSSMGDVPLSYPQLADDAEAVMAAYGLETPVVIGHSDGGITALQLGQRTAYPLAGLVTIGADNEAPPDDIVENVISKLTPKFWREKFPATVALYEEKSPELDFDTFFNTVVAMWCDNSADNYPGDTVRQIQYPALVMSGDRDQMVPLSQTVALYQTIPNAQLGIIPNGGHVFYQQYPDHTLPILRQFLENVLG